MITTPPAYKTESVEHLKSVPLPNSLVARVNFIF